jgi:predicted O-methyltransferase YrrM
MDRHRRRHRLDFAFIDGHHDERATVAYFQQMKPSLSPGAVVLFYDIKWSSGMAAHIAGWWYSLIV